MTRYTAVIYLLFAVLSFSEVQAQCNLYPNQCVDSNQINTYFQCPPYIYNPLCGCDGITYINDCDMYNRHGVCWAQFSGPCGDFHFDIYPTLSSQYIYLSAQLKNGGTALVEIYDSFGHKMFTQTFQFYDSWYKLDQYQLDVSGYELGMYYLIFTSNGNGGVMKFVKSYTK